MLLKECAEGLYSALIRPHVHYPAISLPLIGELCEKNVKNSICIQRFFNQVILKVHTDGVLILITLKEPSTTAADDTYLFLYFSKKIWLDVSSESSARQRIRMKYQVLFSLKNNEKVVKTVICFSRDWRFKG